MPKIKYEDMRFRAETRARIDQANQMIGEYRAQGLDLTLRQLYYQFVARDLIPNNDKEYKKLGDVIANGRLAGLIDWEAIVDRTRYVRDLPHWDSPRAVVRACSTQFRLDKWKRQPYYVECFHPVTPVVTSDGLVPVGAVEEGDFVLTHTGAFRKVIRVIRNRWAGCLLRVKAAGLLPFEVTPNHPIFVHPYDDSRPGYKGGDRKFGQAGFVRADLVKPFDLLTVPAPAGVTDTAFVEMPGGPRSRPLNEMALSHGLLAVLGIYLAEGNVRPDGRTTQFTLNVNEHHQADVIKTWAANVGISSHEIFGPGTRVIYLFSKAFADFVRNEFGSGAFNKYLPRWAVCLPLDKQLRILEYYFRGDGCFWDDSRAAIAVTTRSHTLAVQVQLVLLRSEIASCVDAVVDAGEQRYRVTVGGAFGVKLARLWGVKLPSRTKRYNHVRVEWRDNVPCGLHPVRSVVAVPYAGEVVNLEVEGDHTYCTPCVAHNCWIEKDALLGVIEGVCRENDVPYLACRGYASASEVWKAGHERIRPRLLAGKRVRVLYLGDHDPSGIDMTRDVGARLAQFTGFGLGHRLNVDRLALNMAQVEQYDPPPNPTKMADARASGYVEEFGNHCWELDALDPVVIRDLIQAAVGQYRDPGLWDAAVAEEAEARAHLAGVADNWENVVEGLPGQAGEGG